MTLWWTRPETAQREARAQPGQQAIADWVVVLESITNGFYILDEQWRFTYVNQRALDYFGKTCEELIGRTLWELFPAVRDSVFHAQFERAMRERRRVSFEILSPFSGNWIDVRASPMSKGLAVNFRDVTERKRTRAALLEREAQLIEVNRHKDEFLATLAHELRNPLAPLKNGLQIARLASRADSPLQPTIEMMDRQLNHLVHLVDDLLDVGRISSGKVVVRKTTVMLSEVLAQSTEASRPIIDARNQQLLVEKIPEELCVEGDFERLAQVFSNLLSNAAKYTGAGGQIRIALSRQKHEAVIRVADTGIGIPAQELPHVFDLFAQVRAHQGHTEGGLGIGLSLVKTLVELHDGSVTAESAGPGAGSTFTVRLPLCDTDTAPGLRPNRKPKQPAAPTPHRILVADDNADAAASLATLLEMEGHEVRTAANGEEAVAQSQDFHPDLIFMDLGMPRMDGLEATRRIRALPGGREVAIVALTGWGQQTDRERTQQAGFDSHLVKPVDGEVLAQVLMRHREHHPVQSGLRQGPA